MNKSFKSSATLILGLAILLGGYFGVYSYWGKMGEARQQKAVSQTENDRLDKALADITKFVNDYNTNLSEATLAEKALPVGDPDTAELLDYHSKMVKDSGLNLVDMNQASVVAAEELAGLTPGAIQAVDWGLTVSGSFESFQDYLTRVKNGLRLTDVVSINTDMADSESQDGRTMRFTVKLRSYYQK